MNNKYGALLTSILKSSVRDQSMISKVGSRSYGVSCFYVPLMHVNRIKDVETFMNVL